MYKRFAIFVSLLLLLVCASHGADTTVPRVASTDLVTNVIRLMIKAGTGITVTTNSTNVIITATGSVITSTTNVDLYGGTRLVAFSTQTTTNLLTIVDPSGATMGYISTNGSLTLLSNLFIKGNSYFTNILYAESNIVVLGGTIAVSADPTQVPFIVVPTPATPMNTNYFQLEGVATTLAYVDSNGVAVFPAFVAGSTNIVQALAGKITRSGGDGINNNFTNLTTRSSVSAAVSLKVQSAASLSTNMFEVNSNLTTGGNEIVVNRNGDFIVKHRLFGNSEFNLSGPGNLTNVVNFLSGGAVFPDSVTIALGTPPNDQIYSSGGILFIDPNSEARIDGDFRVLANLYGEGNTELGGTLKVSNTQTNLAALNVAGLSTLYGGIAVPGFGAASNYVWTCTNSSTGAGEWRQNTNSAAYILSINGSGSGTSLSNMTAYTHDVTKPGLRVSIGTIGNPATNVFQVHATASAAPTFLVSSNANVGIDQSVPASKLDVNGNSTFRGSVTNRLGTTNAWINLDTNGTTFTRIYTQSGTLYSSASPAQSTVDTESWSIRNGGVIASGIDGKSIGNTTLYTVPSGKQLVVERVIIIPTSVDTLISLPTVSVGKTSSAYADVIAAGILTGVTATLTSTPLTPISGASVLSSGESLVLRVSVGAVATTYTFKAIVIGILI